MTVDYMGSECIGPDPEIYFSPRRYRVTAHCHRCGHDFKWVTTKLDGKDRPCPRKSCKAAAYQEDVEKAARNWAGIVEAGHGPGIIGDKPVVKAIDETARIVMEDHHMTDLKDNIRVGEAMAPKLPGDQQQKADNFFGGNAMAAAGIPSRQAQLLGRRAIAGAFRSTAINPAHVLGAREGERAPIQTPVRTEKIG